MMLKLTGRVDGQVVYVAIAFIAVLEAESGGGTDIHIVHGDGYFAVKETPEEIMAMPEMVKYLNPMYLVPPVLQTLT